MSKSLVDIARKTFSADESTGVFASDDGALVTIEADRAALVHAQSNNANANTPPQWFARYPSTIFPTAVESGGVLFQSKKNDSHLFKTSEAVVTRSENMSDIFPLLLSYRNINLTTEGFQPVVIVGQLDHGIISLSTHRDDLTTLLTKIERDVGELHHVA